MIQNTILTVILLFIIGCGAQGSSEDNEKKDLNVAVDDTPTAVPSISPSISPLSIPSIVPSSVPSEERIPSVTPSPQPSTVPVPPSVVLSPSIEGDTLPHSIAIDFPNILTSSLNSAFVKDITDVKKIETMAFLNLSLVSQAMPKILNECAGSITCHFQAEEFIVEYNEKNITLEKIDFIQHSKNKNYKYELTVIKPFKNDASNEINDSITYKWTSNRKDVWSFYQNRESNLSLRYFIDADENESMVINDQRLEENSNFIITKKLQTYHLSSNHIKKNSDSFSFNILLEDELIINQNENIVQLYITNESAKEGNYLLLPPHTKEDGLTLKNVLDLAKGTFSFFYGAFQGFLYTDEFLDNLDELTVIELNDEEIGFRILTEESNGSDFSPN